MGTQPGLGNGLSRRELMKRGMRAGAYVAPVVVAAGLPLRVGAVTGSPPAPPVPTLQLSGMTALSVPFSSSIPVSGTGYPPNTTVYVVLLNTGTNTFSFVAVTSDSTGAINTTFNTATTTVTKANGAGSYAVLTTLAMPTATAFTGQIVRDPLTITPATACTQTALSVDILATAAAPNVTYDVFYLPNNLTPGTCGANYIKAPVQLIADDAGVGGVQFPVSLNPSVVTSVNVVLLLPAFETPPMGGGCAPSNPLNPAGSFPSTIVSAVTCTMNGVPAPAQLIALVAQEQRGALVGGMAPFRDFIDVALFNAMPNTTYDFYVLPNGTGTPIKVTTQTTNALGNSVTAGTPVPFISTTGPLATSFVVNAVLQGAPPTAVAYTFTVSGSRLINVPFMTMVARLASDLDYKAQGHGLTH